MLNNFTRCKNRRMHFFLLRKDKRMLKTNDYFDVTDSHTNLKKKYFDNWASAPTVARLVVEPRTLVLVVQRQTG